MRSKNYATWRAACAKVSQLPIPLMFNVLRSLPVLVACWLCADSTFAQTPRVYLKLDANLTDSSVAGIITSINPSAVWQCAMTWT